LSVKRGEWVLVEDVTVYQRRVVMVVGVTAVIRVTSDDGRGDTYRAAELRWCRLGLHDMSIDAPYKPARSASDVPRGGRRVAR
jgi:hypothetical protein